MRRRSASVAVAGLTASVLYTVAVAAGALLDERHSAISDPVSELTSSHAPHQAGLGLLFAGYHVMLGLLAVGLVRSSRRNTATTWGCGMLLLTAVAGLLTVRPFPKDSAAAEVSTAGVAHIALTGFASLTLLAAAVLLALGWREDPRWVGLSRVSLAVGAGMVAIAPVGFIAAALGTDQVGVLDRGTHLIFLVWFAVIGGYALGPAEAAERGGTPSASRDWAALLRRGARVPASGSSSG